MLDVDADCSRGIAAGGARWFEVKSFITNGPGWEPDVAQPQTPYPSPNHVVRCGAINVFRGAAPAWPGFTPSTPSRRRRSASSPIGDTGKGNPEQLDVARGMASLLSRSRGCDFVRCSATTSTTAASTSATDPQSADHLREPYAGVDVPVLRRARQPRLRRRRAGNDFPEGQNQVDYSARSKKWRMPARVLARDAGTRRAVRLDTTAALYGHRRGPGVGGPAWTAASTAPWKIALGHHPYPRNGPHGNAGSYDGQSGHAGSGDG